MSRSTLEAELTSIQLRIAEVSLPIQDCITEGTSGARATEEVVPDGVREGLSLIVGLEPRAGTSAAETEGEQLALTLARLDVTSQGLALRQSRAGEGRVVLRIANLYYE